MAATGYTPISLYTSTTASTVPLAANLINGELAINITDGKLFYKDNAGAVQVIATKAAAGVAYPLIPANGGTGVANGTNNTVTFTGNYSLGLTLTGNTTATFPTSGYHIATVTNMAANPVTGTPSSSTYLRGDGTWATVTGTVPSPYTANGVVYASSTSTLATGTALTFDGTNFATTGAISINNNAGNAYYLRNAAGSTTFAYLYSDATNLNLWNQQNGYLAFGVNNAEGMRLTSTGLGIGTSSNRNSNKLDVFGNIAFGSNSSYYGQIGYNAGVGSLDLTSSDGTFRFIRQSGPVTSMTLSSTGGLSVGTTADPGAGAIYATGNITAYYSSDIKFKENVQDIPDALGIVTAIGSKTFDWTDEYLAERGGEDEYFQPKQSFGVIAQDVQKVFPQAVRTREDGSLAVDYEKLAILSFGAIGQLLKRVEALEAK